MMNLLGTAESAVEVALGTTWQGEIVKEAITSTYNYGRSRDKGSSTQGVELVTTDAEVERLVGEVAAAATALRFEAW